MPVYNKEPYLVPHPVEKEIQVPKTMVQQIEVPIILNDQSGYVEKRGMEAQFRLVLRLKNDTPPPPAPPSRKF